MSAKTSVLIVDPSADSREVLRTGLRRCGLEIIEASHAEQGLEMIGQHHPQIVVLDVEPGCDPRDEEQLFDRFSQESDQQQASLVVLGRTLPTADNFTASSPESDGCTGSQFFSKPYQYAAVIRKIEELVRQASN